MSSRRNTLIRTVAAVCGDIAVGVALASACVWLIEAATLGLFLSFLAWLLAVILSLALSQYLVHPLCTAVLSDRKLDLAVEALSGLSEVATEAGAEMFDGLGRYARSVMTGLGAKPRQAA